jgi:hypothetical protein
MLWDTPWINRNPYATSRCRRDRRWCFTILTQARFCRDFAFIFNGKLSVEQIWQTTLKQFFFTNNGWHDDVLRTLINHSVFRWHWKKCISKRQLWTNRGDITKTIVQYTSVRTFTASPVLFDSLCELVSQNLWLGSKGYPNGLLL